MLTRTLLATAIVCCAAAAWAGGKNMEGVVNLNTAPVEVLSVLPGIGPSKARGIVAYRSRRPFRTVDELVRVQGIGRRMVRELRSHLAVTGPSTAHTILDAPAALAAIAPLPAASSKPSAPRAVPMCRGVPARPVHGWPGRAQASREKQIARSPANHCAPPA